MPVMDPDETLSLNPEFLRNLILQLKAVMAQEETVTPDSGSNPSDDEAPATLQDTPDNLLREAIAAEIGDLEPDQQAQLVALMWIGRGDMEAEEWQEAVELASEQAEGPTAAYLLKHPHAADHIEEGLDRLLDGTDLMETGEY
jgi:hypothetical protein